MRWKPAQPKQPLKVVECGPGHWDEDEHKLDLPHQIDTIDFKITGTGHERIEKAYKDGCANCGVIVGLNEKEPEHRIAAWLCRHACSFVLFATSSRATVLGFMHEEDADAFRQEFVL